MKYRIPLWLTIILSAAILIGGSAIYLYKNPRIVDRWWLDFNFESTWNLDKNGRCVVVELKDEQKTDKGRSLKFYDMNKREFLHLDITRQIGDVKEIRPGTFALFNPVGLQLYSIVIPDDSDTTAFYYGDDIRIIDCVDTDWLANDDKEKPDWMKGDIEKVESNLLDLIIDEEWNVGPLLISYAKENPESLNYPFKKILKETDVSILTSDDGKVRLYTWDTGLGGTSPDFASYIQYNDGIRIKLKPFRPFSDSRYITAHEMRIDGYDSHEGARIERLYQFEKPDGSHIYLVSAYFRSSSKEGSQSLYVIKLENGELVKQDIIDKEGKRVTTVCREYNIPDWYFTTDGLGWDWVMSLDKKTGIIYVPEEVGVLEMHDRYDYFRCVDGEIRYNGNGAGYWLHPSLHDYEWLSGIYQTPTKFIRIDKLSDDQYRYACWNKRDAMHDQPELVIVGAKLDESNHSLIFENDGYEYIVPEFRSGAYADFDKVIVKKNGRIISETNL